MPYKLSPSSLNLIHECERCFWLTQHKIWKRPSGAFPSLSSGMDAILKRHFDNFIGKEKLPPELESRQECKYLKLFEDEKLLSEWRNAKHGLWYEDSHLNVLHGGIDHLLVNKENQKFIVLDYKTRGFPLKEDTHKHYQDQLDIYSFLLSSIGKKTEDYAYLLFYYPKEVLISGEVIFNNELKKVAVNIENAENLFIQAINLLDSACPKESCNWCEGL